MVKYIKSPFFLSVGDIRVQPFQGRGRCHFSGLQSQWGICEKEKKKKVLQKMWELYSRVWVNVGLFRLFQKLASHVCVIFFFFSLSLWDTFFCSILSTTAQLFYSICQPQTHIQLKSTPSLHRHSASDLVATGASDHTRLLICGFSVVLALGLTSGRKAPMRAECWKSKPVKTIQWGMYTRHTWTMVSVSWHPSAVSWSGLPKDQMLFSTTFFFLFVP